MVGDRLCTWFYKHARSGIRGAQTVMAGRERMESSGLMGPRIRQGSFPDNERFP
jgi:hypothetical protein